MSWRKASEKHKEKASEKQKCKKRHQERIFKSVIKNVFFHSSEKHPSHSLTKLISEHENAIHLCHIKRHQKAPYLNLSGRNCFLSKNYFIVSIKIVNAAVEH